MLMENNKILLVEDEKNFGAVLKDYLMINDFNVKLCGDGAAGLEVFMNGDFDLCIIDVMMPRMDGFSLVNEIRKMNKQVPLILLTARSMKEDVLKGYRAGADDYIIKPFDTEVLLLKIMAMLKRHEKVSDKSKETEYFIGSICFSYPLRQLSYADGSQQKLSPKEAELLQLLCFHKNGVLLREMALKQIWKTDNYFTGRSMDVYMVKLRKYLQPDTCIEIVNLHGNGYCLREKPGS